MVERFGSVLRGLRETARLTQEQLAEKAGLSTNAISALERGERMRPYPHTVNALAAALGLDPVQQEALRALVPRRAAKAPAASDVPAASSAPGLPVPRQLTAVPGDFTGRIGDLARLRNLTQNLIAIDGTAGVGKTTLALVWARELRERFPDGQLYANLRGYDPGKPADSGDVLDGFLRALDVPAAKIPPKRDDRAALFRSLTDGKRMLVLLDNASSAEQVRPLLPGALTCSVIVTSRTALTGLAAAKVSVDLLPLDEAVAFLRAIVGTERADAEPEAVVEMARLCARLPLALRLAGQRAASRPRLRLAEVAAELAGQASRLTPLSSNGDRCTNVRTVFSWSCDALPAAQARMFRLLGVHPGPDIGTHAAAALAGTSPTAAAGLLDGLVDAHLIEHVGRDRFASHDLLKAYAREQAATDPEGPAARRRLVGFYLHTAAAADHLLHPGRGRALVDGAAGPEHPLVFDSFDAALAWCEAERPCLTAIAELAAELGLDAAWQLPNNLWSFYFMRKHWADGTAAHQVGLDAARSDGARARMLNGLAVAFAAQRRFDEAIGHFHRAGELFRAAGDRWGEGSTLANLGDTYLGLGRFTESADHSARALAVVREYSNPYIEGVALGNLGEAYLGLHAYDTARAYFLRVLSLCREIDHRHGEGLTLSHLGAACAGLGRHGEALGNLTRALELGRESGDRQSEAVTLVRLADVHDALGNTEAARGFRESAAGIFETLGDPRAAELRMPA
ncbi:ATP-binding protein [Amycolatopsis balhimycina]|uniref:ATP-binding protein n=1 Tax=Amycolatopsis balhimycina TaxID=208443 RepID=UPI00036AFEFA|nr:tetratricopeptide repeat protein [Amycolatopsis balhimycina]